MALALLIAGCGGVTRHQYVQRADGICTATLRSARALNPPALAGSARDQAHQLGTYFGQLSTLLQGELKQLRAVPKPSESRAHAAMLDRYLSALQHSADSLAALAAAARSGDQSRLASLEATLARDPVDRLASAYGLSACSVPAGTYR